MELKDYEKALESLQLKLTERDSNWQKSIAEINEQKEQINEKDEEIGKYKCSSLKVVQNYDFCCNFDFRFLH